MRKNTTTQTIPATGLSLHGHALIEASAGTGKTWTLTGILLRLLIENGHAPRDIIATTFTRAAAAEMRQRIQERVETFRALLIALIRAYGETPALLNDDDNLPTRIADWLDHHPEHNHDPVNTHILHSQLADGLDGLIRAYHRTLLAQQTLDHMFIGTLDSLCQRWLRELALESGTDNIRINTEPAAIAQLSHDHLRRYYQHQAAQHPARFARFYAEKPPKPDDYLANSRQTLNYGAAPYTPLPPIGDDPPEPRTILARTSTADIAAAQTRIADLLAAQKLRANSQLTNNSPHFTSLYHALNHGTPPDKLAQRALEALQSLLADGENSTYFKAKATPAERAQLLADPALQTLAAAAQAAEARAAQRHLMHLHSLQANSEHVRAHLSEALRHSGETTYSELLARLNATLAANPALSRHLAHRYPVLLVDEAQDLNHEQTALLQHIYRAEQPGQGFRLLVGDPKQAIYRFRGSDVQNYTRLKSRIPRHATLQDNYRSSPALIDTLNRYYEKAADSATLGENIRYQPVQAAIGERRIVLRDTSPVTDPVQWFSIGRAGDEPAAIIRLIRHLTSRDSRWLRKHPHGLAPLARQDILILARGNSDLQTLEHALQQAHIDCERQADQSLFAQPVAEEMGWLLAALIEPGNSAIVRRLLAGRFYGFDLATLDSLTGSDTLARFHRQLADAGQRWAQHGLLAALQTLWREDPWQTQGDGNIWTRLAGAPYPDSLRDLLDLRRLQEIIAAHEQPPRRFLDWWRIQLANPPTADWAHSLPLPGSDSVRLMTIHKAKGLQAPVVILAGMGRPHSGSETGVHAFHRDQQLWLATGAADPDSAARIAAENDSETRRLLYVALTRAEDLLFIASRQRAYPPLAALRDANAIQATPIDELLHTPPGAVPWAETAPESAPDLLAPLPDPGLRGWRKTSFTALASRIPASAHDLAVHDRLDLELDDETQHASPPENAAYPYTFPRGPQAGSFLHETLEKIRWTRRAYWPDLFLALSAKHHLPELADHLPELDNWFAAILTSPLTSGTTLSHLAQAERELGFTLALNAERPLPLDKLRRHFAALGKTIPLAASPALYKYLRGEIDLLYRHDDRYHLLDYKSNHLGNRAQDYGTDAMTRAMDDHHYWLQAALYQLALHRLLRGRLPGYHPARHLGHIEYYFIRAAQPDSQYGHLRIDIPADWLLELDTLLT